MRRKVTDQLIKWKNNKARKPLILWGARQVGKTWALKDFGKRYFKNTVYISFYNNRRISEIFEQDYDPHRILKQISVMMHQEINPQETLVIFDEIQGSPRVLESLKYFCEEAREYAIAAAGSLLGVAIHSGVSFPVGKVDEIRLFPMSYQEFLWALDENGLAEYIENYRNPEVNIFRDRYIELLKQYYVVGGMPEVVSCFCENKDFDEVREHQISILAQYEGDFGKHVEPKELPRIKMVWQSLPLQLAKENKKFFFGQIKTGARSKDYEIAIQWLLDSGLIHKVNKVSKPGMPLKSYIDLSSFKIYMNDVGLLGALGELDWRSIIYGDNSFTEFKGALTEQYVLQQMIAETKYSVYYYSTDKSAYEIDFMIQHIKGIVPIEVKAEENLRAKSLKVYCEKYVPEMAVRISMSNYREEDWMVNIPLWAFQSI